MPKKAAKNAYFYFMMDYRDEQKKNGKTFANMQEVQQAADPVWRASNPSVRAKYEKIAKAEKAKNNIPEQKYTSFGVPFSELENQERQAKEAADRELKDIHNFVFQNSINMQILDEYIYVIDVNALCETNVDYVFGEVAVIRFNIRNGITDHIHTIINPPIIPIGYASDIKRGCEKFGLDFPDSDAPKTDYMQILALIVTYLKENDPTSKVVPPLYTMPEKEDQVLNFISQLCHKALEDEGMFRVYKLDVLFFYMINTLSKHKNEGLPKESLALAALRKDPFKYTPGIGCEHHESGERTTECCKSRVKRWVYTVLDSCCPVAGVQAVPGKHVPEGTDLEAVMSFKEKKMEENRCPLARAPSTASYASSLNDSYEAPAHSTHSSFSKPQPRSLQPLRKPTVDTLRFQSSIVVAPELSESNFPPLNLGGGRGAGRNLPADMKNLNLNK